jgi:hypothetical protein
MNSRFISVSLAIGITAITAGGIALAQSQGGMSPMMQGARPSGTMGSGTMQGGMSQDMMGPGAGMMSRPMGQNMMCPMMTAMMQANQGAMGPAVRGPALFGSHVTPMMNLSVEDVRSYLALQLDRLNNKRLKIGNVTADGETISAEIVTVDNSLVQRLKIDRRTGSIEYES